MCAHRYLHRHSHQSPESSVRPSSQSSSRASLPPLHSGEIPPACTTHWLPGPDQTIAHHVQLPPCFSNHRDIAELLGLVCPQRDHATLEAVWAENSIPGGSTEPALPANKPAWFLSSRQRPTTHVSRWAWTASCSVQGLGQTHRITALWALAWRYQIPLLSIWDMLSGPGDSVSWFYLACTPLRFYFSL